MVEYKYSIRDDPKNRKFDTEEELKKLNPNFCNPGEHKWKSTFVFGVYDCRKCEARKTVR